MNILVADDHPMVRVGVRLALENTGLYRVSEANCALQALSVVKETRPQVAILDLEMPGPGPARLIHDCYEICPDLKVLILSSHTEDTWLGPLQECQIAGFLVKDEGPANLLQALRVIEQGSKWFSHSVIQQFLNLSVKSRSYVPQGLTPREEEVLSAMLTGRSNNTIALEMGVSRQTIRRHAATIYEKLQVKNRIELLIGMRD